MGAAWDERWDVIVVGCGYAGAMAAIAAHDAGARVLVVEKMPDAGGISICSAGGLRIAEDAGQAFAYLKATNRGATPDDVLETLAQGMAGLADRLRALARECGAEVALRQADANYPFDGHRTFGFATVTALARMAPPPPGIRGGADGHRLFRLLEAALTRRGVELRLNAPATALAAPVPGRVDGVIVERGGRALRLAATGGVVLACGGFEADEAMQRQYWNGVTARSAAFLGNTGDGIRMAQSVGADLWHMWHYHGTYGFRHADPAQRLAIRTKRFPDWVPGRPPGPEVKMPWILLDRAGRRFMNEYDPYLQDTGARPFAHFDPQIQDFPRIPAWLIADEDGRRRMAFGRPAYHQAGMDFDWSPDNLREVGLGILRRADDLGELAAITGLAPGALEATLTRWNRMCAMPGDADFARPAGSMTPIRRPPFYAAQIWPVVNNTQGGPVHDPRQRVLGVRGAPIAGLYAAGELGSAFGFLYMSGGNIAECFIGGEIAGAQAAKRAVERQDRR